MAVRYCKSCGQEFERQARFCSNCGTPRPTSPLTKANPAPTFTPEEILASLEEEVVAQEQAAEAPRIEDPEPVREAARVPTPPPLPPPQGRAVGSPISRRQQEQNIKTIAGCATAVIPVGLVLSGLAFGPAGLAGGVGVLILAAALFAGLVWIVRKARRELDAAPPALRHSRHIPQDVKIAVTLRDGGKCRVCGSEERLQYDHIYPWSLGGRSDDPNNIQLLCGYHNRLKSNR